MLLRKYITEIGVNGHEIEKEISVFFSMGGGCPYNTQLPSAWARPQAERDFRTMEVKGVWNTGFLCSRSL